MSNLVIVAIPDENDRVWKISSDEIPHLTLLFLGEVDKVANLEQIILFVEHAASMSLKRFHLMVDRRGELGEDKADVLFFKKSGYDYKAIHDFRAVLLQDNNIKTAYDSATQFDGPWQPHLTLGYPAIPAKTDDSNFGFYNVSFNRIAAWVGDFDGPEFLLKDYWDEFQDVLPMDVAMSALLHAAKVSDTPWSQFKDSDFTDEQYARACLLDRGEAAGTTKQRYGLPVREPSGTLNRNACHAAAAVLSSKGGTGSARGNKVKGTPEQIAAARKKLVALYNGPLGEDVPEGLGGSMTQTTDLGSEFILEHFGVKGMRWGVTRTNRQTAAAGRIRKKADVAANVGATARGGTRANAHIKKAERLNKRADRIERGANTDAGLRKAGTAAVSGVKKLGKAAGAVGRFAGDVAFESNVHPQSSNLIHVQNSIAAKAGKAFKRTDLPALKERHGDYGKLTNRVKKPFSKEARAYRKDARETYIKRLEDAANSMTNISGTRQYTVRERGWELPAEGGNLPKSKHVWYVTSREIKHADGSEITTVVEVIEDNDGWITDLQPVDNSMAQTIDLGAEFLAHYGIKGMRWGVRKQETEGGGHIRISKQRNVAAISTKAQVVVGVAFPIGLGIFLHPRYRNEWKAAQAHNKNVKADKKWKKRVDKGKRAIDVHNTAADEINSKIGAFNNDKRWKNVDLTKDPTKQKAYDDAAEKELLNPAYANATVKIYGAQSPSGRYKFEINNASTGTLKIKDTFKEQYEIEKAAKRAAKHAAVDNVEDNEEIEVRFKIKRNTTGHIIGLEPEDNDSMAQSAFAIEDLGAAFIIEHFGVKGMRWGVRQQREVTTQTHIDTGLRRRRTKIQATGGEAHDAHPDAVKAAVQKQKLKKSGTDALSTQELRDLANRLQVENQVAILTSSKGKQFVSKQFESEGKKAVGKGVGLGIAKGTPSVLKKAKKGAATAGIAVALL